MINVFDNLKNISYFETIDEYTNFLEESKSLRYGDSDNNDYKFSGTKSLKEALELCKYGDEDLRKYIYEQNLKFDNVDSLNKVRRSTVNDVVGFMPNVPNYIIGIPTNMIRDNRTMINSKVLNIFINISAAWYVNKDDIKQNAAKYVCAINRLEEEGYRCNVYAGSAGERGDRKNLLIVKIKSDKEPMNLAKMAFPLCHPSMLRRLKFKWIETVPIDFGSGYGSSITNDNTISNLLKCIFKDVKFTILSVATDNGKIADVIEVLKKKGMVNNERIN